MRPRTCADHSIIARAVGTAGHITTFVCCARELVQQAGTAFGVPLLVGAGHCLDQSP